MMKINRKRISLLVFVMFVFVLFFSASAAAAPKNAVEAVNQAQAGNQWAFVMFVDKKDAYYKAMDEKIRAFIKTNTNKPSLYKANIKDEKESEAIAKYRVTGAPMPLLLVFAPNGVITGGYAQQVTEEQLVQSFPSALFLQTLKPLQDGKLVLLMLQNNSTKYNKESVKAADDFSKTKGLAGAVEIVYADPEAEESKDVIKKLNVAGAITEATIVMLVPPGRIGGVFKGKTDQKKLMAGLQACSAGSCKPGACGPKK